jgi:choline dehydrogenase-like flavoprotein
MERAHCAGCGNGAPFVIADVLDDRTPLGWETEVAIVGSGPAGMVLAQELAKTARVLVVERGGIGDGADQSSFLEGETTGIDYPLTETRAFRLGGSSNLWAGYCACFDPLDFLHREWVPDSGWPIEAGALLPYYGRAAEILNLSSSHFDTSTVDAKSVWADLLSRDALVPTIWRFGSPTMRFSEEFQEGCKSSRAVTTLLNATVVDLRLDAGHGLATEACIRTPDGRTGTIRADTFVLACGGIETPRLLLNAASQCSNGVGNASDMVGRCFMEHPHREVASVELENPGVLESWTQRLVDTDGSEFLPCIGLSGEAQRELQILNARAHVYRTPEMESGVPPRIGLFLEQAPNRNSRLMLSEGMNTMGMRKVRLDWSLSALDQRTYEKTASAIAGEVELLGAGRTHNPIAVDGSDTSALIHSNHHLGTTRMSESSEEGVVNPECRLHDVSNVYIIGGSVFPTVSWANPTFTVLALTLRLADHLVNIFRGRCNEVTSRLEQ